MKNQTIVTKMISLLLAGSILLASCASTTIIQSNPNGAKVYLNGEPVGTTPYTHQDTKIVGSTTIVKLEKEGYEPLSTSFSKDEEVEVGAIIGGLFVWVPFLWAMKYKPTHTYELTPSSGQIQSNPTSTTGLQNSNSTNELIKLKNLLDQQAITKDDYTTLKVKILDNRYEYTNSIAEQIIKLKSLLDSDLLTKDEYLQQKNKVINSK